MWTPWRPLSEVTLEVFALVVVSCVAGKGVPPAGIGVPSLLAWVAWKLEPGVGIFDTGGRYVWPSDGVKLGREDAVESSLVREATVESSLLPRIFPTEGAR